MNVTLAVDLLPKALRRVTDVLVELLMGVDGGVHGRQGHRALSRPRGRTRSPIFPSLSVGVTYLPIPIGGVILLLFVIEHLTIGPPGGHGGRRPLHRRVRLNRTEHRLMDIAGAAGLSVCAVRDRRADRLFAGTGRDRGCDVDRRPARGGDAQDLRRRQQGRDADDSVLRAGGRDHGRGRHGEAPGRVRERAGRHGPRARRTVRGEHRRHDVPERHIRIVGRGRVGDRLGDDSADGKDRLPARVRDQRHHQRIGAGDPGAAFATTR